MLDSELELIFAKLIKKCLDSSSFILEEVKRALLSICSNCNEGRVIALLVNAHTTKANPIKIVLLYILEKIVFRPKIF